MAPWLMQRGCYRVVGEHAGNGVSFEICPVKGKMVKTEVRASLKDQEWLCANWGLGCLTHQHAGKKLDYVKKSICVMVFQLWQWNIMSFFPLSHFWPEYVSGFYRRILCVVCIFTIMTNSISLWLERSLACLLVAFFCFLMKPWVVDLNNRNYRMEFLLIWGLLLDLSFRWLASGCRGKMGSVVSILIFWLNVVVDFSHEENVYCYLERAKAAVVEAWISKSCFFLKHSSTSYSLLLNCLL